MYEGDSAAQDVEQELDEKKIEREKKGRERGQGNERERRRRRRRRKRGGRN